jgi:hypothetical protein
LKGITTKCHCGEFREIRTKGWFSTIEVQDTEVLKQWIRQDAIKFTYRNLMGQLVLLFPDRAHQATRITAVRHEEGQHLWARGTTTTNQWPKKSMP